MSNVEILYRGDKHADALYFAMLELLEERAEGMSIPAVLGVLVLVMDHVKRGAPVNV